MRFRTRPGLHQDIPRMRVRVEEAIAKDLLGENFDQLLCDLMLVDAGALDAGTSVILIPSTSSIVSTRRVERSG